MLEELIGLIILIIVLYILWKWLENPESADKDIKSIKKNLKEIADTLLDTDEGKNEEKPAGAVKGPGDTDGLKCPDCGAAVKEQWKACPECTAELRFVCPECGEKVKTSWKACPNCTESLD